MQCRCLDTLIVGSGAAALGAAEYLARRGRQNIALVTEGMNKGTSRNTGSDKQTYYKLNLCGSIPDSVRGMAECLFAGGAMDGDTALVEAALSARGFFRLVELGVPFPHNAWGEYVGYKTDHDPAKRGTSIGPLTSRSMTELLQAAVERLGVPVFDNVRIIELLTSGDGGEKTVRGALGLNLAGLDNPATRYILFAANNIVYGTGAEAGLYERSVYPPSQTGSTGVAFRAGAAGKNLTEWQYGLASTKFRWNLSGTYQQALPRYVSTREDGSDEREFLDPFFASPAAMLTAIFLKGYQWPFDPRKTGDGGSSLIDILVHEEMEQGRRVFLDYRRNPSRAERNGAFDPELLEGEAREYLENSGALLATPFERLAHMNPAAVELYRSHGIDLSAELLEIAVCAQHNNGGLAVDAWWRSNLRGLYPVGEVSGTHGVYRPGGSALNSGQVGGMRAAECILHLGPDGAADENALREACGEQIAAALRYGGEALASEERAVDLAALLKGIQRRMSRHGAHIRVRDDVARALEDAENDCRALESASIAAPADLALLHTVRDMAVCQAVYLAAILDAIDRGVGSRGSYLVMNPAGEKPHPRLPGAYAHTLDRDNAGRVQEVVRRDGNCFFSWRNVRPIPPENEWFETVWREYNSGEIFPTPLKTGMC